MKKSIFFTIMLSVGLFMGSISHGFASDWTLNKSTGNVDFYYKIGECNGQDAIFLKIVNKNNYGVKVTWTDVVNDNVSGMNVEARYGLKEHIVAPGASLQSDCSEAESSDLIVLAIKIIPTHKADITNFEFKNVKVIIN